MSAQIQVVAAVFSARLCSEVNLGTHRFQRAGLIHHNTGFGGYSRQDCTLEAVHTQIGILIMFNAVLPMPALPHLQTL
jgi:hypothetical protein